MLSSSPSETGNGASMVTPPSSFGTARHTSRRRSGEGVALTPSLSPTVTGFTVPPSSNEGGSVGTKMMTRMTPLGARSPVDFPEETVVGFDIGVQHVESKSPPMSPGGLSRSMSALKSELVSTQTPSLSPEKPPLHSKAAGQSGLLSGRLEALTADEESTLEQAQRRHRAFSSPAVVSAFRVAAAAHRGQLRKSGDTVLSAQVATALIVAELGMDSKVVAAALLHDVLDDTPVTERELRHTTPDSIVTMVTGRVQTLARVPAPALQRQVVDARGAPEAPSASHRDDRRPRRHRQARG